MNPVWWITKDGDEVIKKLYEKHYSSDKSKSTRAKRNPKLFVGPGQKLVLRTLPGDAFFVWRKFKDDSGQQGVNCAAFRNESGILSSELIRQADAIADFCWPGLRHYTYVNAGRIRSINAGCCFKKAGWKLSGTTKGGLMVFEKLHT